MMRLLEKSDSAATQKLLQRLAETATPDPEPILLCMTCLQAVTSHRHRIEVQGASEHIYTNPHGFRFHIICFREAPGCLKEGEPALMHTWFAEYRWCYALCSACRTHLGWHYAADRGDCFYGLIKDRLVEGTDGARGSPFH